MLSKSTVVALCSLLVYVNFISALDIFDIFDEGSFSLLY